MPGANNWEYRQIAIDFDVFKELTARLEDPSDDYNQVLRRMFKLHIEDASPLELAKTPGEAWVVGGTEFPAGMQFRASYKGNQHFGEVKSGALFVDGVRYKSPSRAAMSITHNSVNGWIFWECKKPADTKWSLIDSHRKR